MPDRKGIYRYLLPASLLQDVNSLEIRVSNTPGNQHQFTNSFRKWGSWQLTPYHDIQKLFDIETLDSGLYGPVLLYTVQTMHDKEGKIAL